MRTIPTDYLHELFNVDFETGALTWRERPVAHFKDGAYPATRAAAIWNGRSAGKVVGSPNSEGYLRVKIDGRHHQVHRVIFAMAHGCWPIDQIDHLNGVRTDNRLSNLRVVSNAENHKNRTARRGGTSRFPGVSWHKARGKWRADIMIDGKQKYLGLFTEEVDAAETYRTAARAFGFSERHLQPAE